LISCFLQTEGNILICMAEMKTDVKKNKRFEFSSQNITRRDFIKRLSGATAGFTLLSPSIFSFFGQESKALTRGLSRVVVIVDQNAISGSIINQAVVQTMINEGIKALTGLSSVGEAWLSVFPGITSSSVIGIKVNSFNYKLPAHPEVAFATSNSIANMQVEGSPFDHNNIIIWDRYDEELTAAGYVINTQDIGVRCFGTQNPVAGGNDYSVDLQVYDVTTHPSKIITNFCDFLISLSCLKNHEHAGVTLSMKNYIGAISDFSLMHPNYCDPYIPALLQQLQDLFGNIHRISIIDALFGTSVHGQGGDPEFTYNGIILGTDPVAVDYIGMRILQDHGCPTAGNARHIASATGEPYNLGTNDPELIELITITDPSDMDEEESETGPKDFQLNQNFPNPFNSETQISYFLPKKCNVRLTVYNLAGQRIRTLINGQREAGLAKVCWDAKDDYGMPVASGIYFYELRAERFIETKKALLLK
jgi:hypothetical protein